MTTVTKLDKIYNKYAELKEKAKEDCKFDKSQIENSFDSTTKKIWWINQKTEWNRVYREIESRRKDQYKKTYEFYYKEFPMKLNSKEEYNLYIETDPAYSDIYNQSLVIKEIILYIDSVLDSLKDRGWEIKNFLQWLQFSNGQ